MIELDVKEMTCGRCVAAVTRAVRAVDPEADVGVDLQGGRVRVESSRPVQELIRALDAAGYPAAASVADAPAAVAGKRCCCSA